MGRLIKNHWARLIVLSAAACELHFWQGGMPSWVVLMTSSANQAPLATKSDQCAAAIESYFWPKIFWDFITTNLDGAVRPIPSLQTINLVLGLVMLAWEWPAGFIAGSSMHRSIEIRLAILPGAALAAALLYQGTNAALYYLIGMVVYFWAYSEGEVRRPHFPAHACLPPQSDIGANQSFFYIYRSSAQSPGLFPSAAAAVPAGFNLGSWALGACSNASPSTFCTRRSIITSISLSSSKHQHRLSLRSAGVNGGKKGPRGGGVCLHIYPYRICYNYYYYSRKTYSIPLHNGQPCTVLSSWCSDGIRPPVSPARIDRPDRCCPTPGTPATTPGHHDPLMTRRPNVWGKKNMMVYQSRRNAPTWFWDGATTQLSGRYEYHEHRAQVAKRDFFVNNERLVCEEKMRFFFFFWTAWRFENSAVCFLIEGVKERPSSRAQQELLFFFFSVWFGLCMISGASQRPFLLFFLHPCPSLCFPLIISRSRRLCFCPSVCMAASWSRPRRRRRRNGAKKEKKREEQRV